MNSEMSPPNQKAHSLTRRAWEVPPRPTITKREIGICKLFPVTVLRHGLRLAAPHYGCSGAEAP